MVGWILRTIRRPRITGLASEHLKEFPSDLPIHQFSWQYYARFGSWEVFPIFFPIDRNFATSIPKMVGEFWHCDCTEKWGEVLARAHRSHSSAVGNSGWKLGLVREGYPGENKLKKNSIIFFQSHYFSGFRQLEHFLKWGGPWVCDPRVIRPFEWETTSLLGSSADVIFKRWTTTRVPKLQQPGKMWINIFPMNDGHWGA